MPSNTTNFTPKALFTAQRRARSHFLRHSYSARTSRETMRYQRYYDESSRRSSDFREFQGSFLIILRKISWNSNFAIFRFLAINKFCKTLYCFPFSENIATKIRQIINRLNITIAKCSEQGKLRKLLKLQKTLDASLVKFWGKSCAKICKTL